MRWSVPLRTAPLRARFAASAVAMSLLAIAGCSSTGPGTSTRPNIGHMPRSVFAGPLGDAEPVAAVAAATRMSVQGIDVARYNGSIDWPAVKRAGISFAYIKTTEGGDHADPMFFQYWSEAKAAGIHRGAYHFMYWCRPADEQALFFMVNVPNDPDALPPVLDLEWNHSSKTCPGTHSEAKVVPMIRTLLDAMEARTGKRPIIYTDPAFYGEVLRDSEFAHYPFWLRSVAKPPHEAYLGQPFVFWQFTATGRVPGIDGDVDRNVFNGSADDWERWLQDVGVVSDDYAGVAGSRRRAG